MIDTDSMRKNTVVVVGAPEAAWLHENAHRFCQWRLVSVDALVDNVPPTSLDAVLSAVLDDSMEPFMLLLNRSTPPPTRVYKWLADAEQNVLCVGPIEPPESRSLVPTDGWEYESTREFGALMNRIETGPSAEREERQKLQTLPLTVVQKAASGALLAAGLSSDDAAIVVASLTRAERAGYSSHGFHRVPEYVTKIGRGVVNPRGRPTCSPIGADRMVVDGDNALGPVVAAHVREHASALEVPIGWIAIRNSGHLGRVADLIRGVAEDGRLAIAFVNGRGGGQKVTPAGGSEPRLATNPIAFACPVSDGDPIIVDVGTASSSDGAVQVAAKAGNLVAAGVLIDRRGQDIRTPAALTERHTAFLQPLGGREFGHKGYGLGLMVEVLAGVWGRGGFSQPGRLSSGNAAVVAVLDPRAFGAQESEFLLDVDRLLAYVASSSPVRKSSPVRIPGRSKTTAPGAHDVYLDDDALRSLAPFL